jgi:hypothetical protein
MVLSRKENRSLLTLHFRRGSGWKELHRTGAEDIMNNVLKCMNLQGKARINGVREKNSCGVYRGNI